MGERIETMQIGRFDPGVSDTRSDFDAFYHEELPSLVAIAAAICGSHHVAEELAQDAMAKAFRRWDRLVGYDKPGAWARRVTINSALSTRRRAATEMKVKLGLVEPPSVPIVPSHHDHIWEAVATLPPKQRAAIALRYLEDRPVHEIADLLGCSPSTASVHLTRARTRLAELLGGER